MSPTAKTKKRTVFGQSVFVCFMRKNVLGCDEVFRLPLTRARRVKKICRWHIFSQSGEQVILATRAIGCHEVTEGEIEQTLKGTLSLLPSFASQNPPPSSEGGLQGTMPTSSRFSKLRYQRNGRMWASAPTKTYQSAKADSSPKRRAFVSHSCIGRN